MVLIYNKTVASPLGSIIATRIERTDLHPREKETLEQLYHPAQSCGGCKSDRVALWQLSSISALALRAIIVSVLSLWDVRLSQLEVGSFAVCIITRWLGCCKDFSTGPDYTNSAALKYETTARALSSQNPQLTTHNDSYFRSWPPARANPGYTPDYHPPIPSLFPC